MKHLLRNRNNRRKLVPEGEAIGDANREKIHATFDESIHGTSIQKLPRTVLSEIAGLDGGVVIDNHGRVLAYASVLKTRISGKLKPAEGSRTKAAISALRHGIAVTISSDGDIICYENAAPFLRI